MKKIKLLLLGIVTILGISCSFADFSVSGQVYEDGIYYNSSLGLITVISDTNIATLQDKNLGATKVYDGLYYDNANTVGGSTMYGSISNDSVDVLGSNYYMSSCDIVGNLYQWGNNYGFDCSGVLSTMLGNGPYDFSTVVNYDYNNYGPDNPLSSSILLSSGVWRSPNANLNIWGGITGTPESQQGPCPDGYYIQNETDWGNFKSMLLNISGSTVITKNVYNLSYFLKLPVVFNINTNITYDSYWLSSFQGMPSSRQLYPGLVIISEYNSSNHTLYQTYSLSPNQAPKYFISTPTISGNGKSYLTPIRCFKNTPVLPNNNWVSLIGGDTSLLPDPEPDDSGTTVETGHIIVDGGYTTFAALVLETSVLCYMSDGEYNYTSYYIEDGGLSCSDLGGSSGYVPFIESLGITNDTGIQNKYWSGDYNNSGFPYGKLVFDDAKNVLKYYCSDSRYSYSFCDNLDLLSGSYLFYQFKNGVLEYNIIGENILLSFDTMSGVISDMSCYGVWCSSFPNTGFTQIDVNVFGSGGSIELSGYFVHQFQGFTSGSYTPQNFYSDYFKKGYFFKCPYNVKQYITFGSRLDSHLKQYSPSYPINCFISSFEAGRNLLLFKNSSGQYWSGSLINGNSDDHQLLFIFFDIILSFGLIIVIGKLFNILSNSGK